MRDDTDHVPVDARAEELQLLQAVAAGDEGAFEVLFRRYFEGVYRYLARMVRNEAMAEEIANETLIDVWRGAERFRGDSKVSTWIFSIAHNKAVSELRKKRLAYDALEAGIEVADDDDSADDAAELDEAAAILRRCMDKLSPAHREVMELAYYQEMSITEVSDVMSVPSNTVKTRMFHGRKQLRACVERAGLAQEDAG